MIEGAPTTDHARVHERWPRWHARGAPCPLYFQQAFQQTWWIMEGNLKHALINTISSGVIEKQGIAWTR